MKKPCHFLIFVFLFFFAGASQVSAEIKNHKVHPKVRYDDLPEIAEFVVSGRSWDHNNLTYYFQTGTQDIAGEDEKQAFRDAFGLWASVTPLIFTETNDSSADIVILFAVGDHGDGFPFDGQGGIPAHTFYPPPGIGTLPGDSHYDDDETWTLETRSTDAQPFDLVTFAAHEIGHALGLAHSTDPAALMYPYYSGSHRSLAQDDINGIQSLYGTEDGVCAPPEYGDWVVSWDCSVVGDVTAPAQIVVDSSATLTITSSASLDINLEDYRLLVEKGSGVLVKKGGKVY